MSTPMCSIDGCDRDIRTRGMCDTCYQRLRRQGVVDLLPTLSATDRFEAKCVRHPNGCLEWTGATNGRYGQINVDGKLVLTHRFAWSLANGPIPDGMYVCHRCDNPPCCETEPSEAYPEGHLFLGTPADNNVDMWAKGYRISNNGYRARTHCPARHDYTEANTYVTPQGHRKCRACGASRNVVRRAAKRRSLGLADAAEVTAPLDVDVEGVTP